MPAPNSVPRFVTDAIVGIGQVTTANTARDGTGAVVSVVAGSAQGTLIELIRVVATGTTTAGVVRLFIHNGSAYRLYEEILVTAITPSTTTAVYEAELVPTKPLVLPTGYTLYASTHNTETFNVIATGGDY